MTFFTFSYRPQKALSKLGAARRLMLTGTPLHNNLQELCSLLYFLNPSLFGTFAAFSSLMDGVTSTKRTEDKETAIAAIRDVLAPFILRRLKSEVLQLPDKKKFKVKSEMSDLLQRQAYLSVLAGGKAEWNERGETVRGSSNILMSLRQVKQERKRSFFVCQNFAQGCFASSYVETRCVL
jgi:SNF2 family DNA or RNA helicase